MAFPALLATGLGGVIVAGIASGATQTVLKVLGALGFGYLTFTGADFLVAQNEQQILTLMGQLPPLAVQLIGVLQLGTCMKIIFSALVLRLSIAGLNEGVIKRMKVV